MGKRKEWFTAKDYRKASADIMSLRPSKKLERMLEQAAQMEKVVAAVLGCDGVKRCIDKGCDTCRYNGTGCNSLSVVNAVKEFTNARA